MLLENLISYKYEERAERKHMVRASWNHFTLTGSVDDYLKFKEQEKEEQDGLGSLKEKVRGEQDRGHKRDGYGYGAYRNANQ